MSNITQPSIVQLVQRSLTLDDFTIETTDEGRTIVARALTYGAPYNVTDDGVTFYREVWRMGVFDKSLRQRAGRIPLMTVHNRRRLPIGAVQSTDDSSGAFIFTAKVSRTRDGDEALELLNDGVLTGVSVGARILANRQIVGGVERLEARLEEISLAPASFTQMSDAGVLAVRATLVDDDEEGVAGRDLGVLPATPSLDEARAALARYTRP